MAGTRLFTPNSGHKIKFYSNAINFFNPLKSSREGVFIDIFNDLESAKNTICIVGWNITTLVTVDLKDINLAKLLVTKALQGVKVILLIWDNITPQWKFETNKFLLSIQNEIEKLNLPDQEIVYKNLNIKFSNRGILHSDHQKIVVIDDVLYIGGLDLSGNKSNPNMFHDCHSRVTGPVLADVIAMILSRWDALCVNEINQGITLLAWIDRFYRDEAKDLETSKYLSSLYNQLKRGGTVESTHNTVQLVLSIRKAYWGRDQFWKSPSSYVSDILKAHLTAINQAERFIYMENQFFIGDYLNDDQQLVKSSNKVVEAIKNKIIEKIKADQPFHFYCQLPFMPEGEKNAPHVYLVLHEQWKTMKLLIMSLNEEAEKHGKTATQYLTFYNLGYTSINIYRMKYTHSKLMIIDDKQLLIGSANCNERSMSGDRDCEADIHVRGHIDEIKSYRKQLMCEHFGDDVLNIIESPESKECRITLQRKLEENLLDLPSKLHPCATPWGNIRIKNLVTKAEKPPHVLENTPPLMRTEFIKKFSR